MAPTAPVKIKRPAFHVWLDPRDDLTKDSPELDDDELVYHHVVVNNGDQLRAELEAGQHKIKPREQPMHLTTMWVWAAMVRTGDYEGRWPAFKLACIAYDQDTARAEPLSDPDAELDELDEHPT